MKIYNESTKQKDEIKKNQDKKIRFYVCGPTVYDYAHLGNLRTYIYTDILRRALKNEGHQVIEVMNITDIDDKIIKKAQIEGLPYKNVTQKYKKAFLENIKDLNIERPEHLPEATDEEIIKKIIEVIDGLMEKGYAYKSEDDSIYFSIERFSNYGKLSGVDISGIKSGARVSQDEYDKENPRDFVLWKAHQDDEPYWPAPFGDGRPGWHIECTAMALKYLGETIDIHAGGVDLIFPHHENEIAQSEAYTGKQFVKNWFHCEFLFVEGEKMSKSLKNIYTLEEMEKKYGIEPLAFRLLVIMSHYRERLNFTRDSIIQAQKTLNNLRNFVLNNKESKIKESTKINVQELKVYFSESLNDDLNSPKAIAYLFGFIKKVNIENDFSKDIYKTMIKLDNILGLGLAEIEAGQDLEKLFEEYLLSKAEKNYKKTDLLRSRINKLGWVAEDYHGGSRLRLK